MISIVDVINLVVKSMSEKKKRVALTISGIIIGIFTFTFFLFASQGLSNAITEQFSAFGLNVIGVQSVNSQSNGPPSGKGLTDTEINKIKQVVRNYKYIAPTIFSSNQYEYGREKQIILALSYKDEDWKYVVQDLGLEMEKGRFLRPGDRGVIVLGAKTAKDTFSKEITIGNSIKVNGKSLRVIGIIKERGDLFVDSSAQIAFDDMKEISGQDTYSVIRVSLDENADIDFYEQQILNKLNPNPNEKEFKTTTPKQAIDQFNNIIGVLQIIISIVSFIALLVGGINVMNTIYSNVLERINEISVMKAIGATNFDVIKLFLVESSILGFIGGLIGFLSSYSLAELLSYIITNFAGYNVPVSWDTSFFLITLIVTSIAAMVFGTYPALRAARVNPAENLRDE